MLENDHLTLLVGDVERDAFRGHGEIGEGRGGISGCRFHDDCAFRCPTGYLAIGVNASDSPGTGNHGKRNGNGHNFVGHLVKYLGPKRYHLILTHIADGIEYEFQGSLDCNRSRNRCCSEVVAVACLCGLNRYVPKPCARECSTAQGGLVTTGGDRKRYGEVRIRGSHKV